MYGEEVGDVLCVVRRKGTSEFRGRLVCGEE